MERVKDVRSLLGRLGPVIYAPNRRAALKRAGIIVDPTVPSAVRAALKHDPLGMAGRQAAATTAGPTVPVSLMTGTTALLQSEPRTVNGFDMVGTVFLSSFEEILAKLWEALVYPHDVQPTDVAKLFSVDLLRSCFTGVPDGAQLGPMLFPAPPRLRVATPDAIDLNQPLRAQLLAPGGGVVELVATATVTIPLEMVTDDFHLRVNENTIGQRALVAFRVDPGSGLQPLDLARLQEFASQVTLKLRLALAKVATELGLPAVFEVPGGFTKSKLRILSPALWLSTWNHEDQVTFGMQVEPEPSDQARRDPTPPENLAPLANLFRPDTIAIIASESLVERGLRAVAASGQLADRISEKLEWLREFQLPTRIEVEGVDVRFDDEAIKVGLDCRYLDVCAFLTDFDFRATVDLRPETLNGQLRLLSDGIDLDLDNVDAVLCALTSPLTGPWGFVLLTLGSVIAAVSSTSFNKTTPGFWQGQRLPDSDVYPRIDLNVVGSPSTGILHVGGTFGLVPDEVSTFVATQVLAVSEKTGEVTVVEGATVELSELGAPAPAGDDYVPPRDFTGTRTEVDGTAVQVSGTYAGTFADVLLAGVASERHGLARFAVLLDDLGGLVDVTEKRTTPGGATFTIRRKEFARGDAPDLAVTVTLPDGYQPIVRQPIAVNLADHGLGTVQEPIRLVYVDRCIPQRRAVTAAEAKVAKIEADLQELRDEFDRAPASERDAIGKLIRRMEKEFLTPAIAERKAARAAREACRVAG
jgi:hypothetical protein